MELRSEKVEFRSRHCVWIAKTKLKRLFKVKKLTYVSFLSHGLDLFDGIVQYGFEILLYVGDRFVLKNATVFNLFRLKRRMRKCARCEVVNAYNRNVVFCTGGHYKYSRFLNKRFVA